jgi:hypothetical protein
MNIYSDHIYYKYINFTNFILKGSFPNSHCQIELELLRIIMQNWRLDDLISNQLNNSKLFEGLKLVKSRPTAESLSAYDNFECDELCQFRLIYSLEVEDTITGSEQFSGKMMIPRKQDVILLNNIYKLLVDYYNNAYNLEYVTISESIESRLKSRCPIVVRPIINQYGCI